MKITEEYKQKLENIYQSYLNNKNVLKMKEIPAHRGSNVYIHTFRLVKAVMKKALKSRKELDLETLLIATIFHDYYLYDWRTTKDRPYPHGKHHPFVAIKNAKRDFNISDKAADMISTHMWPLNPLKPPKTKEARILCNVDTWIALKECLTSRKYKTKKEEQYLSSLNKLFD